jgi:hypothetical protein
MTPATGQVSIGFCRSSCSEARAAAKAYPSSIFAGRSKGAAAFARAFALSCMTVKSKQRKGARQ